jgi:hypothetical protein
MLTLLHADVTRGLNAVERLGVLPNYKGTAIHDRLAMYFNYTGARHGVCGPISSEISPRWRLCGTRPNIEAAKHGIDAMDVLTASVRLRTLEDADTDAHLIAPSLPRSPLHYYPL